MALIAKTIDRKLKLRSSHSVCPREIKVYNYHVESNKFLNTFVAQKYTLHNFLPQYLQVLGQFFFIQSLQLASLHFPDLVSQMSAQSVEIEQGIFENLELKIMTSKFEIW